MRGGVFPPKQSPKGQFCPFNGRLLRPRTPRSDILMDFKKALQGRLRYWKK
jgi:hypothetical protein